MNMKYVRYIISVVFIALLIAQADADRFYLGGIQVNEPDAEKWINELINAGMNTVEVTVYAHQGDWDSDNLWFDATSTSIIHEIRTAKKNGMYVVLILRVALDHVFVRNKFLWHGQIMPKTDEQLISWFHKYSLFTEKWAKIAQEEGVDILGISSELNRMTSTVRINNLPDLENYYLDQDKQNEKWD